MVSSLACQTGNPKGRLDVLSAENLQSLLGYVLFFMVAAFGQLQGTKRNAPQLGAYTYFLTHHIFGVMQPSRGRDASGPRETETSSRLLPESGVSKTRTYGMRLTNLSVPNTPPHQSRGVSSLVLARLMLVSPPFLTCKSNQHPTFCMQKSQAQSRVVQRKEASFSCHHGSCVFCTRSCTHHLCRMNQPCRF